MIGVNYTGACCQWPKAGYDPATLPESEHAAVREFFRRSAMRDILPDARTIDERNGLMERCEEVASEAYLHWRTKRFPKVAAGDHSHAIYATRRYFRLTGWHGMTGMRRKAYRKRTREMIAERERFAARNPATPPAMAMAIDRLIQSPAMHRKAQILAQRCGFRTIDEMLANATGEGFADRGRFVPQPTPTRGVPAMAGDGTEWRSIRE